MSSSFLIRLLGGPPVAVLLRLAALSVLTGALLYWFDIRPGDVIDAAGQVVQRLWDLGFAGLQKAAQYALVGAVIVVPVWILLRLARLRSPR